MILNQYECASKAVSGGTCFGGVDDLLAAGVRNMRRMTPIQICRYENLYHRSNRKYILKDDFFIFASITNLCKYKHDEKAPYSVDIVLVSKVMCPLHFFIKVF